MALAWLGNLKLQTIPFHHPAPKTYTYRNHPYLLKQFATWVSHTQLQTLNISHGSQHHIITVNLQHRALPMMAACCSQIMHIFSTVLLYLTWKLEKVRHVQDTIACSYGPSHIIPPMTKKGSSPIDTCNKSMKLLRQQ